MMISTMASQVPRLSLKDIAVVRRRAHATTNRIVAAIAKSDGQQVARSCSETLSVTRPMSAAQFSTKAGAPKLSYFERKQQAKEDRVRAYEEKLERLEKRQNRRAGKPKDILKNQFRPWWNQRKSYEEMMDRRARQQGLDWKIEVAVILERIPMVLPDKDSWEKEFEELDAYLSQFGTELPRELSGDPAATSDEAFEPAYSDEDLIASLPEGFVPAPRETEADMSGEVRTLDRKLKTRVFLAVQDKTDSDWTLPTVPLQKDETLLEAAKRAISEQSGGKDIDLYCASNCPVAVDLSVFPEEDRKDGFFGVKTFFMRVQHDEGNISTKGMKVKDFAWLDRDEIAERMAESQGLGQSKFYNYLL